MPVSFVLLLSLDFTLQSSKGKRGSLVHFDEPMGVVDLGKLVPDTLVGSTGRRVDVLDGALTTIPKA